MITAAIHAAVDHRARRLIASVSAICSYDLEGLSCDISAITRTAAQGEALPLSLGWGAHCRRASGGAH